MKKIKSIALLLAIGLGLTITAVAQQQNMEQKAANDDHDAGLIYAIHDDGSYDGKPGNACQDDAENDEITKDGSF